MYMCKYQSETRQGKATMPKAPKDAHENSVIKPRKGQETTYTTTTIKKRKGKKRKKQTNYTHRQHTVHTNNSFTSLET